MFTADKRRCTCETTVKLSFCFVFFFSIQLVFFFSIFRFHTISHDFSCRNSRRLVLLTSRFKIQQNTGWRLIIANVIIQQLLECVNDDQVTYYASANRDLQPSEGDPSPLLTPDPLPDSSSEPLPLPPPTPSPTPTPTCAPTTEVVTALLTTNTQVLTIFSNRFIEG